MKQVRRDNFYTALHLAPLFIQLFQYTELRYQWLQKNHWHAATVVDNHHKEK
jgi:hypothetical protein